LSNWTPAPTLPDYLPLDSIEVIPQVFQHREDAQWISDDHVQTLVKSMKNSTKAATKRPQDDRKEPSRLSSALQLDVDLQVL
jgi:hypothetical protein